MARDNTPDMSGFGYIDSPRGGQAAPTHDDVVAAAMSAAARAATYRSADPGFAAEWGRGRFLVKEGIGYSFRYRSYQYCKFHSEEPYVPCNGRGQRTFG